MWDTIIRWSLNNRVTVFLIAIFVVLYGIFALSQMKVDALPDITAPTVTIVTDCGGMAPAEVEKLVTFPVETALNGAPKLRRLRSKSQIGMSIVLAEFSWDTDQYTARQIVSERLQLAKNQLPPGIKSPVMAPMTSIMGEIMVVGLSGDETLRNLRDTAQWVVRRRLLGINGVAQVTPMGGEVKQLQIVLNPHYMRQLSIGHRQVIEALADASENYPGGFFISGHNEYVVRAIGRAENFDQLGQIVVARREDNPILLRHIASINYGSAISRGSASINGKEGVLLIISKQPGADTVALSEKIDKELDAIETSLPAHMHLFRDGFRQETFISRAISNVSSHLFESSILVILILFFFLANTRTTLISLTALPLSLLSGVIVIKWFGQSINTMTLGGFAIAIGALVDDAIIDVENAYRRLRLRAALPEDQRDSFIDNIYKSSVEIRSSIVYATLIIALVFLPLFFLTGLEGRLMKPLGTAYVVSILTSLLVAVTVTPALCAVLLKDVKALREKGESSLSLLFKKIYRPILNFSQKKARLIAIISLAGTIISLFILSSFGRNFMPRFNEGSFSIAAFSVPGISLEESTKMVSRLDKALTKLPFVTAVTRRTGRSDEKDEHGHPVQVSGLDIMIDNEKISQEEAEHQLRKTATAIPGLAITLTQPISFRIAHMNTGSEASIALKIFGEDLLTLRTLAKEVEGAIKGVEGVVDLKVQQQTDIPQLAIHPRYASLAAVGATPGELARFVQTAFVGAPVGTWWEKDHSYEMVVTYPKSYQKQLDLLHATPFDADGSRFASLSQVAHISKTLGPNMIERENVARLIKVTANTRGRDGLSVIRDIQKKIEEKVHFPAGYYVSYGGDFESEARASRTIFSLSIIALVIILLMLWSAFGSLRNALLILANLPLALVGGTVAVFFMESTLSIASLVGFITLFGIASRNGIMMISHYQHLQQEEGCSREDAVFKGSMERLIPIMMTALATALALIPIAFALNEPGNEIQAPMALVILCGIVSSTFLNMIVIPALYTIFGREES